MLVRTVVAVVRCEGVGAVLFVGIGVVVEVVLQIGIVLRAVVPTADEADTANDAIRHLDKAEIISKRALVRVGWKVRWRCRWGDRISRKGLERQRGNGERQCERERLVASTRLSGRN